MKKNTLIYNYMIFIISTFSSMAILLIYLWISLNLEYIVKFYILFNLWIFWKLIFFNMDLLSIVIQSILIFFIMKLYVKKLEKRKVWISYLITITLSVIWISFWILNTYGYIYAT
jgi:hypothetical protein